MVMQTENASLVTGTVTDDRGMKETSHSYGYTPGVVAHHHSFLMTVFAGTIAAISLSVLSYALMFACHVGLYNPQGDVNWGVGAVIWSVLTAALTFFIGGYVAGSLSPDENHGWIQGFMVWALSVPLVLILTSFVAIGTSMAYGGMAPAAGGHVSLGFVPTIIQLSPGVGWMLFLSLISGLVFAVFGGLAGGDREYIGRLGDWRTSVSSTSDTLNVR
jgi:hypothetical protein